MKCSHQLYLLGAHPIVREIATTPLLIKKYLRDRIRIRGDRFFLRGYDFHQLIVRFRILRHLLAWGNQTKPEGIGRKALQPVMSHLKARFGLSRSSAHFAQKSKDFLDPGDHVPGRSAAEHPTGPGGQVQVGSIGIGHGEKVVRVQQTTARKVRRHIARKPWADPVLAVGDEGATGQCLGQTRSGTGNADFLFGGVHERVMQQRAFSTGIQQQDRPVLDFSRARGYGAPRFKRHQGQGSNGLQPRHQIRKIPVLRLEHERFFAGHRLCTPVDIRRRFRP